jgi:transcriptional regulator with XRE-family HTH domain
MAGVEVAVKTQALVLERKIIGVLIRAARENGHRTVEQVAKQLRTTSARVLQYEHGTREISVIDLQVLAHLFRVPVSFFLNRDLQPVEECPAALSADELKAHRGMLGAKLKQARLAAGKSVQECALVIERTAVTIEKYERGASDILITELERLAEFLNASANQFVSSPSSETGSPSDACGAGGLESEAWNRLPPEVRSFVLESSSLPYLRMALKFRDLPTSKLQELGEIMLVVRYKGG